MLSALNKDMLKILRENGRLTNKECASLLNCSEKEAQASREFLEEQGILASYTIVVNDNHKELESQSIQALVELSVCQKKTGYDAIAKNHQYPQVSGLCCCQDSMTFL